MCTLLVLVLLNNLLSAVHFGNNMFADIHVILNYGPFEELVQII